MYATSIYHARELASFLGQQPSLSLTLLSCGDPVFDVRSKKRSSAMYIYHSIGRSQRPIQVPTRRLSLQQPLPPLPP